MLDQQRANGTRHLVVPSGMSVGRPSGFPTKEFPMATMKAARLHEVGKPFQIDDVPMPEPGDLDVVVRVEAGIGGGIRGEAVGVNPKDAGNLTGPKAASYIADHENLAIAP